MRMRGVLKDEETGEETVAFDGPAMTPAEVVEADLARARRVVEDKVTKVRHAPELAWVFWCILSHDGESPLPEAARLEPTLENLEALLTVTRQSAWRRFDRTETLGRYLNAAVRRQAERTRVNRRKRAADEKRRTTTDAKALSDAELGQATEHAKRAESREDANLSVFLLGARADLTLDQRRLLDLMLGERLDPADALKLLGLPKHVGQNLVRKLRRHEDVA